MTSSSESCATTVIVIDASVLTPLLIDDGAQGTRARSRVAGEALAAPALVDLEVVSVVRGLVRGGYATPERAASAIEDLAGIAIERCDHRRLVERCWQLRNNVTPYDAACIALAEALDVTLVTADARLARATGPRCAIELLDVSN